MKAIYTSPGQLQRFFNQTFAGQIPDLHQPQIVEHICVCKHATQIPRRPTGTCLFHTCPNCKHWHTILFVDAEERTEREFQVIQLLIDYDISPSRFL